MDEMKVRWWLENHDIELKPNFAELIFAYAQGFKKKAKFENGTNLQDDRMLQNGY